MGDVSSGMASTVIQLYLKEILESFVHPNVGVRQAALRVIQLILSQGLVHPVQVSNFHYCSRPRVVVPFSVCSPPNKFCLFSVNSLISLDNIKTIFPK